MKDLINSESLNNIELVTCIATGNRMFSGWNEKGHKVRPIHELCNVIESGEIGVRMIKGMNINNRVGKIHLWNSKNFCDLDLENYISGDSLHTHKFNSMVEFLTVVKYKKKKLSVNLLL